MHMGWLGGHFEEEYTPGAKRRRGAKASVSVMRLPSCRNTASVPAASLKLRPRTRSAPCSATKARSAFLCSAAQRAGSPAALAKSIGGLPGSRSTLSSEVEDEEVISAPERLGHRPARAGARAGSPDRRGSGDRRGP